MSYQALKKSVHYLHFYYKYKLHHRLCCCSKGPHVLRCLLFGIGKNVRCCRSVHPRLSLHRLKLFFGLLLLKYQRLLFTLNISFSDKILQPVVAIRMAKLV